MYSKLILEHGWPLQRNPFRGFPETPLVHFHGAILSVITDLPIFPSVSGSILVSYLLPIFYVSISISILYIYSLYILRSSTIASLSIGATLVWLPLFETKLTFARQSLGFVLFVVFVYSFLKSDEQRHRLLSIFIGVLSIMAHHFVSLAIGGLVIGFWIASKLFSAKTWPQTSLLILLPISFISWFVLFEGASSSISSLISTFGAFQFVDVASKTTSSPPKTLTISTSFVVLILGFFSYIIYQLLLAGPITYSSIFGNIEEKRIELVGIFLFGAFTAAVSAFGFFTGAIAITRPMTLFTVVALPLAFYVVDNSGITTPNDNLIKRFSTYDQIPWRSICYFCLILFVSLSFFSGYVIDADVDPRYEVGKTDQRFGAELYSNADFTKKYRSQTTHVIGDLSVVEVFGSWGKFGEISSGYIFTDRQYPTDTLIVIRNSNYDYYFGNSKTYGYIEISLPKSFSNDKNRIYSSGSTHIYKK